MSENPRRDAILERYPDQTLLSADGLDGAIIGVALSGDRDRVRCRRCAATADLLNEYRTKTSVHLEFARKHFYKCVVPNTALSENAGIKAATEPAQELFHGQA